MDNPTTKTRSDRTDCEAMGLYLRDIRKYTPLSREEEARALSAAREGDGEALNSLVTANLRFVVRIARQFKDRGLPLSDLIAEGNLGLIRASQTFDSDRGCKFITYAVWWIRQAILIALKQQTNAVSMPINQLDDLGTVNRAASALSQELERTPDLDELAEMADMSVDRVRRALEANQPSLSMESTVYDDGYLQYSDTLPTSDPGPDEMMQQSQIRQILQEYLDRLPAREAEVLVCHFGFDTGEPESMEQIGKRYHLSRERIRQIKDRALSHLGRRLGREPMLQSA